jgi:hypothetical protein
MRRRSWLRACVLGALALGGCLAPTLPVPPPSQPDITAPDADGNVTLRGRPGGATGNAEITVFKPENETFVGALSKADGSWLIQIRARSKEKLWVWQTVGYDRSGHIEVEVP